MDLTNISSYESIANAISSSFSSLVNMLLTSVDNGVFSVLDELVFINSSTINDKYFVSFFNRTFSIVSLCNALLFAFLIYYIISYFFSLFTCSNFQKPLSFVVKLFISAFLIHFSLDICGKVIEFFELLTNILRELSTFIFSTKLSFTWLYKNILNTFFSVDLPPFQFFSFDGVLKTIISFSFINLLFTYSIRFIFIKILVLVSPFAFLSLALDQSSWIFKIWLKNFLGQLFIQLFICVILFIIFSFSTHSNPVILKLLYLASVICLIKASSFIKEFTSGFTTDVSSSFSSLKSLFF